MVFTKEQLKEELKRHEVEFHATLGEKKLAKLLVETYKAKGLEVSADLLAQAGDEADETPKVGGSSKGKHTMLCNVKHDGVYYKQGSEHDLDKVTEKHFRDNKFI